MFFWRKGLNLEEFLSTKFSLKELELKDSQSNCCNFSTIGLIHSGQIVATSHGSLTLKCSFLEGKSPYFREI